MELELEQMELKAETADTNYSRAQQFAIYS